MVRTEDGGDMEHLGGSEQKLHVVMSLYNQLFLCFYTNLSLSRQDGEEGQAGTAHWCLRVASVLPAETKLGHHSTSAQPFLYLQATTQRNASPFKVQP